MAEDKRRFTLVTQVDDPLTLDAYLRVLEAAGIAVLSLDDEGVVGGITDGFSGKLYEIRVPEESLARATQLLTEEQARLEASASEAGEAAVEEEAAGEAAATVKH
jgi:hypothetical protein